MSNGNLIQREAIVEVCNRPDKLNARWHRQVPRRLANPRALTEAEIDEGYACFGTEDFRIGYRAFLDKTKPEFKGH